MPRGDVLANGWKWHAGQACHLFLLLEVDFSEKGRAVKVGLFQGNGVPAYEVGFVGIVGAFVKVAEDFFGQVVRIDAHQGKRDANEKIPGLEARFFRKVLFP